MNLGSASHLTPGPVPMGAVKAATLAWALTGLLATPWAVHASAAAEPAVIGEATLVIGQAKVLGADGQRRGIERGATLRVGDAIETADGGHVHVRFVDGARASVRPRSRLVIESYAYSPDQPRAGSIKFRLDEGVVRSITGAWGEAARDRFRLNTPIAAIGVKGTDFVVRSAGEATAATVFTGAIVMAPLTGSCAASVGPCTNGSEALLSADMKGQMIELNRQQPTPRLVPSVDLLALARTGMPEPRNDSSRVERSAVAAEALRNDAGADKPLASERLASDTLAAATAAARNAPEQALLWVRNPWAAVLPGDDFAKRFDDAVLQGFRAIVTDGSFSLRRPAETAFAPTSASATFRLTSSAAGVFRPKPYDLRGPGYELENVQITQGTLQVDFARSAFATDMTATGPTLGATQVQAVGLIDATGAMRSSAGNASMVGGFNGDGHKAGLAFRSAVPGGTLQGVTLWGR